MGSQYADELEFIIELISKSGELAQQLFLGDKFEVFVKDGGSKVTSIDLAVSHYIVEAARRRGIRVRSEEAGSTGQYGENMVLDLDPIDGTSGLATGYSQQPRRSNAAPSLGFWDNGPVAGAVIFPLLGVAPIMYLASQGGGAYREQAGQRVRLRIDTAPTRGLVFVSSKTATPKARQLNAALSRRGYTPVPAHGIVFKACGVADRDLRRHYPGSGGYNPDLPVVGFVCEKAWLHDVAAVTCIVREAGGIATVPQNQPGKQLWVAANNQTVYDDLMELLIAN